jgi:hypothetical protein
VDTASIARGPAANTGQRVRISGPLAAEIKAATRDAATIVGPLRAWTEIATTRDCGHDCGYGCKLFARTQGAVTTHRIIHSATYGCPLGRDAATRVVPVHITSGGAR